MEDYYVDSSFANEDESFSKKSNLLQNEGVGQDDVAGVLEYLSLLERGKLPEISGKNIMQYIKLSEQEKLQEVSSKSVIEYISSQNNPSNEDMYMPVGQEITYKNEDIDDYQDGKDNNTEGKEQNEKQNSKNGLSLFIEEHLQGNPSTGTVFITEDGCEIYREKDSLPAAIAIILKENEQDFIKTLEMRKECGLQKSEILNLRNDSDMVYMLDGMEKLYQKSMDTNVSVPSNVYYRKNKDSYTPVKEVHPEYCSSFVIKGNELTVDLNENALIKGGSHTAVGIPLVDKVHIHTHPYNGEAEYVKEKNGEEKIVKNGNLYQDRGLQGKQLDKVPLGSPPSPEDYANARQRFASLQETVYDLSSFKTINKCTTEKYFYVAISKDKIWFYKKDGEKIGVDRNFFENE
jgi:hypothetical protein